MFIRNHTKFHHLLLLFGFVVSCSGLSENKVSHAASANWADSMFETKNYDFGSVPLLSEAEYRFTFTNDQWDEVRITSVSSSCSCTDASYSKNVIKRGESGEIIARVNTNGQHKGNKGATIRVLFDKPGNALVQLVVSVYIRPDVVLNPGRVDFGAIGEGKAVSKIVRLQYAGRPDWGIVRIDRANNNMNVTAKAMLVSSKENAADDTGEVTYDIVVTLNGKTPPGYVHEILRLETSDSGKSGQRGASIIELPVTGMVMDSLVAKPSPFQFGFISPGETVTKYLVLSSGQPFRIKSVNCPKDRRFKFFPSDQLRSIHVIAVSFTSREDRPEDIASTIFVRTDLPNQELMKIDVFAKTLSSEDVNFNEYYAPQWRDKLNGIVGTKVRTPKKVPFPKPLTPVSPSDSGNDGGEQAAAWAETSKEPQPRGRNRNIDAVPPVRTRADYVRNDKRENEDRTSDEAWERDTSQTTQEVSNEVGHDRVATGEQAAPALPLQSDSPFLWDAEREKHSQSSLLVAQGWQSLSPEQTPKRIDDEKPDAEDAAEPDDAEPGETELRVSRIAPKTPREFAAPVETGWIPAESLEEIAKKNAQTSQRQRLTRALPLRESESSERSEDGDSPKRIRKNGPEAKFALPRKIENAATTRKNTAEERDGMEKDTPENDPPQPNAAVHVKSFAPKPGLAKTRPHARAADPEIATNRKVAIRDMKAGSYRPQVYVPRSDTSEKKLPNMKNLSLLGE